MTVGVSLVFCLFACFLLAGDGGGDGILVLVGGVCGFVCFCFVSRLSLKFWC